MLPAVFAACHWAKCTCLLRIQASVKSGKSEAYGATWESVTEFFTLFILNSLLVIAAREHVAEGAVAMCSHSGQRNDYIPSHVVETALVCLHSPRGVGKHAK